jgi:hypothetical protein
MRLSGDKKKARELERRARSYVGYLFDQMPERQKFRSQTFKLEDGSSIVAYVWKDKLGTRAIAKIYARPGEAPVIIQFVEDHGLLVIEDYATDAGRIHLSDGYLASLPAVPEGLDANQTYPSQIYKATTGRTEPPWEPHKHTGLGMLWVQGLLQQNKTLTDVIPTKLQSTWTPNRYTLVRGPQNKYYLVYWQGTIINANYSAGMHLFEMEIPGDLTEIIELEFELRTTSLSKVVYAQKQSRVLSELVPVDPTGDTYYTVASNVDIYNWLNDLPSGYVYNSTSGFSLHDDRADFIWSFQERGNDDEFTPLALRTTLSYYHTVWPDVNTWYRNGWSRLSEWEILFNISEVPFSKSITRSTAETGWVIPSSGSDPMLTFYLQSSPTSTTEYLSYYFNNYLLTQGRSRVADGFNSANLSHYYDRDHALRAIHYKGKGYSVTGATGSEDAGWWVGEDVAAGGPGIPGGSGVCTNYDLPISPNKAVFISGEGTAAYGGGPYVSQDLSGELYFGCLATGPGEGDVGFYIGLESNYWSTSGSIVTALTSEALAPCYSEVVYFTSGQRYHSTVLTRTPASYVKVRITDCPYAFWVGEWQHRDPNYSGSIEGYRAAEIFDEGAEAWIDYTWADPLDGSCGGTPGAGPESNCPGAKVPLRLAVDKSDYVIPAGYSESWQFRGYLAFMKPAGGGDSILAEDMEVILSQNAEAPPTSPGNKVPVSFSGYALGQDVSQDWVDEYPTATYSIIGSPGLYVSEITDDHTFGWVGGG